MFLDQRLQRCLSLVASRYLDEHHVLEGLLELNATPLADFDVILPPPSERKWFSYNKPRCAELANIWDATIGEGEERVKENRQRIEEYKQRRSETNRSPDEARDLSEEERRSAEKHRLQNAIEKEEATKNLAIETIILLDDLLHRNLKIGPMHKLATKGDLLGAIECVPQSDRGELLSHLRTSGLEHARPVGLAREVWTEAVTEASKRGSRVLGTRDYLRALFRLTKTQKIVGDFDGTSLILREHLRDASPETVIDRLSQEDGGEDGFSIGLLPDPDGDRINVSVVSSLGRFFTRDCAEREKCGLLLHRSDAFGVVTDTQIGELEELLNDARCEEAVLQRFFELNPQFFGFWEWREIFPQLCLASTRDARRDRPDFILTDPVRSRSFVVDLKLPSARVIRNHGDQVAPTRAFIDARDQLLRYGRVLRDRRMRDELSARIGTQLFEPHLAVIIGRSGDYRRAPAERTSNPAWAHGVRFYDYDEILQRALNRRRQIARVLI